jgi:hypothetical protein
MVVASPVLLLCLLALALCWQKRSSEALREFSALSPRARQRLKAKSAAADCGSLMRMAGSRARVTFLIRIF